MRLYFNQSISHSTIHKPSLPEKIYGAGKQKEDWVQRTECQGVARASCFLRDRELGVKHSTMSSRTGVGNWQSGTAWSLDHHLSL